jgi:L-rhamnose mutarotase
MCFWPPYFSKFSNANISNYSIFENLIAASNNEKFSCLSRDNEALKLTLFHHEFEISDNKITMMNQNQRVMDLEETCFYQSFFAQFWLNYDQPITGKLL